MGKKAFESIAEGLDEAIAYAKGDTSKGRAHVAGPDPKAIREGLGLSQAEFAARFEMSLGTVTKWEQGHRVPRGPAATLLRVIEYDPKTVMMALASKEGATPRARRVRQGPPAVKKKVARKQAAG